MSSQQSSYRQIMKATSLFGGVQLFNIVIQIVRSKFVAVLLGPAGMGVIGLLQSTIGIISNLTNFGLGTSAVRDVASANSTNDQHRLSTVVAVFRRLVWFTGLLGSIVTLLLSPWLSRITFNNDNYTWGFVFMSVTLLFNQLSVGQNVVLQGMRKLHFMAKSNIIGSALGLILTLPLYYVWGIKGIVPALITTSMISLFLSSYFSRKISIEKVDVSRKQTLDESKLMIKMGVMVSMSGLLVMAEGYLVRIFISHTGGIADVGLYNAGFAIINTYVGMIFAAMATDYYPRLSSVAHDKVQSTLVVNQQAEIAILILAPILLVFLVFIQWIVVLLYSTKFLAVNNMIYWAAMGMFFKAVTWSMGFLFLAKGKSKIFFCSELASNLITLTFNITGYWLWGLTGLGVSFFLAFILAFIQVYLINRVKFGFLFNSAFTRIFIFQFSLAIGAFLSVFYLPQPYPYVVGLILITLSAISSYRELDKRIGLGGIMKNTIRRLK
ncbi:O-antigen translocase [Parabacteroides sp. FAFU027]|uniref:O-antigen translocase n=1 Tax=Parabacteroides sp. FAFU027 TaxID=2922715 RepID=UPI001FB033F9|nr:O-antigen translocase [Parabacteroides sp. FAFU027]